MTKMKVRLGLAAIALALTTLFGAAAYAGSGQADSQCPERGYGRCGVSGCYCRGFEGSGNTCYNCGHGYFRH